MKIATFVSAPEDAPSSPDLRESGFLVTTRWLHARLDAPWLRVLDVRASAPRVDERTSGTRLRDPRRLDPRDDPPRFIELGPRAGWLRAGTWPREGDHEAYARGHVPGATSFDVARAFFDEAGSLVWAAEIAMAMSAVGVGDEHTVVLVDDRTPSAGLVATSVLRRAGHDRTFLLSGGFPRWLSEGRPVTSVVPRHGAASFTARMPS